MSAVENSVAPFSERLRRSSSPAILLRTLMVAAVSVVAGPIVLMVLLLLGGVFLGGRLAETGDGALLWAGVVSALIVAVSAALLLFGTVAVGTLHRRAHLPRVGGALLAALRALPRLALAMLVDIVLLLVVTVLVLPVTAAALITALVLFLRNARMRRPGATRFTRGTRIALLAAIPLLPTLALLALLPALLAASLDGPRSLRALVGGAIAGLRRRMLPLAVFVAVSAAVSAGLSWAGTLASRAIDGDGTSAAGLLVLAGILAVLIAVTGAALAVIVPAAPGSSDAWTAPGTGARAPRRPWRRTLPLTAGAGRVAMLVVVALIVGLVPTVTAAAPAEAATASAGVPAPADAPAADAPLTPELRMGMDGMNERVFLSAEVEVTDGDPLGMVQFYDGTAPLGAAAALALSPNDSHLARASLNNLDPLDPGQHSFSFTFEPAGPTVAAGTSNVRDWKVVAATDLTISTDADAAVNGPATVTVTVTPGYPTSMQPDGTVDVTIDGDTHTLTLVNGTAQTQVALLVTPDITADYSGSALFTPSTATYTVGKIIVPDKTQIVATVHNPPFRLGTVLNASAVVTAPGAVYGTVVKGAVQVWAGQTLLTESTRLDQSLSIPTSGLHAGATDLRFVFVPAAGFETSETTQTVTLAPARTSVTATLQPAASLTPVPRGNPHSMSVALTSDLDGPRTVEVRTSGTSHLVATGTVTISGGTGSGAVDLTGLLAIGRYDLVATVVGDGDRAAAASASQTVRIGPGLTSTTLTVSASPVEINTPVTVVATTTATEPGVTLPGAVTFELPDRTSASVPLSADGTASYTYTPTRASTEAVRASYFDSTLQYEQSNATTALVVTKVTVAAPVALWSGDLSPRARTLTLTYAAAPARAVPSGGVLILDAAGKTVASGNLVDGAVTVSIVVPGTRPVLHAAYDGDGVYDKRDDVLPVAGLQNYTPVVTVGSPASAALGTAFPVTVDVTDVPADLVATVELSATAPDATVSSLGSITLDSAGHGSASPTLLVAGIHDIRAVVTFSDASELAPATSASASTSVRPVPVPRLTVTRTGSSADLAAGDSVTLTVAAKTISPGETGIAPGTKVTLMDATDTVLGATTLQWSSAGLTGTVVVPGLRGGTLSVRAVALYGPLNATVESAALDLAVRAPETSLGISLPPVTVGENLAVTVTAVPQGSLTGKSRSLPATVTVLGSFYTLDLTRSGATGPFTGTVAVRTQHAGNLTVEAATPGDGVDTSAATASATTYVDKRPVTVQIATTSAVRAGEDVGVIAQLVQTGTEPSPIPTGTFLLSVHGNVVCAIDGIGRCTIPGASVNEGVNSVHATYAGDADNAAASLNWDFTASARTADLKVSFSPTVDKWVYGEPITATWTTTTSGPAARGTVGFDFAGSACEGAAAAGSCTITPVTFADTAPVDTAYTVRFISSDGAPGRVLTGIVNAQMCTYLSVDGTVDYRLATRCGESGEGVVTGSTVHITATPQRNYRVDGWTVNGVSQQIWGTDLDLRVTGFSVVRHTERWAPTCYTLWTAVGEQQAADSRGEVRPTTKPNCSDPLTSTPDELARQKRGESRYAAGTTVTLLILPVDGPGDVASELDSLWGATRVSQYFATTVMDEEKGAAGIFRVKACTAVSVPTTEGGGVRVVDSTRPASSKYLRPASGACSVGGQSGYVPGTVLTLEATPDSGASFDSWQVGDTRLFTDASRSAVPVAATGSPARVTSTQTVPYVSQLQLAARFSLVKCVAVTIVSKAIWGQLGGSRRPAVPAGAHWAPDGPITGCGGIGSTTQTSVSSLGGYRTVTTTDSMVATSRLRATTTEAEYPIMTWRGYSGNTASVRWSTDAQTGLLSGGSPGWAGGPAIDLATVGPAVTITAGWYNSSCRAPNVTLPQGGSYIIAPLSADESYCERPGELGQGKAGYLLPAAIAGSPNLVPITTIVGVSGQDELATISGTPGFFEGRATVYGGGTYRLEYCAPLGLDIRVIDDSGAPSPMDEATAKSIVLDDGGCPALYSRPGRTVSTALTVAGQYTYAVQGANAVQGTDGTGPTLVVDGQGNVSGPKTLDLKIRCFTLSGKDLSATTPGNCIGGAGNRYTRGTTVQLQAEGIEGNRFDGWKYADASTDQTAWVIMDKDRYVEADIHRYSKWEKVGNWFSSISQRMLAAVVTVATGVSLAQLLVAKVAAVGLKLSAAGLRAAGAGGAVADAIDKAGTVIQAQVDLAMLATKCLNDWANGKGEILTLPSSNSSAATLGAGKGLGPNATAEDIFNAAKADLETRVAAKTGYKGAIPIGAVTGDVGTFMNVAGSFGENLSMYGSDAKTAWSSYASSMRACMAEGIDSYVKDTYTGY